jgi:DNA uptake protein ComE-like DNA-binding protein
MYAYVYRRWLFPCAIVLLASFVSCIQPDNPQDLKEKTAKATEDAKRDAKAVAEGIREGWSRDKPLNLNTATKDELLRLPGISSVEADRIIAERPYHEPDELVSRHILPKSEYDRIADLIKVK